MRKKKNAMRSEHCLRDEFCNYFSHKWNQKNNRETVFSSSLQFRR